MPLDQFVDTLTLREGLAAAGQSCLVPRSLAEAPPALLWYLGQGYAGYLARLPLLSVVSRPQGGHSITPRLAGRRLPLLSFAAPYLTAHRSGRELRYPIVGGLLAQAQSGYLAFGIAPEAEAARLWIDVIAFRPRLGLGPLYFLSQAQLHRVVTTAYLRQVVPLLLSFAAAPEYTTTSQLYRR